MKTYLKPTTACLEMANLEDLCGFKVGSGGVDSLPSNSPQNALTPARKLYV